MALAYQMRRDLYRCFLADLSSRSNLWLWKGGGLVGWQACSSKPIYGRPLEAALAQISKEGKPPGNPTLAVWRKANPSLYLNISSETSG